MPLARIDLIRGRSPMDRKVIGDVVYEAMVEILKAPKGDRFQVIAEHGPGDLIYDPTFFGIDRTNGIVIVQLTLVEGRSIEQKSGFYKRLVDDLHERVGVRREDVFVSLVGTGREDWSFGNGVASLMQG